MTDPPQFEPRALRSADPTLSDEANRRHGPLVADMLGAGIGPGVMLLAAVCVLAIVALVCGMVAALVVLGVATVLAVRLLLGDPDRLLEDLVEEFRARHRH